MYYTRRSSSYLSETVDKTLSIESRQAVTARLQVDQLKARDLVVVAELFDGIALQVEPEEGLWDEGVVKPLEAVV